jgi:tyrosine-protein kinase Fer
LHHFFIGSQIFQAWKKIMEEIEQQSKLIRSNAEHLEILCSDRMAQMCQDKRKLRKQYQEEHAKIASPFTQVSFFSRISSYLLSS